MRDMNPWAHAVHGAHRDPQQIIKIQASKTLENRKKCSKVTKTLKNETPTPPRDIKIVNKRKKWNLSRNTVFIVV